MEREIQPSRRPEFSAYFRKYIEEDMKNGMLLSFRRYAGLSDDFCYNNAQECSNFKYKSKIREAKMADFVGYRPNVKCTWVEAILHYEEMVGAVNRDKRRAVIAKGAYLLSSEYEHLYLSQLRWSKMSIEQKRALLAKVDGSCKDVRAIATDLGLVQTSKFSCAEYNCNLGRPK